MRLWLNVQRCRPRTARLPLAIAAALLFSAIAGAAQNLTHQLYEGLTVSTVDLVAQPSLNVEPFRPLVAQKANSPYSAEAIQRTVAALQATGKFPKVDVDVKPGDQGLLVTFLLEPVFYVGMIDFPGATREFNYQRLLQVVNYSKQDPYEAGRAMEGENLLRRFFARQGYFQPQVMLKTKVDNPLKLVNLGYNVTLGKRAKFGNIQITGPQNNESKELDCSLRSLSARLHGAMIKEGKPYDPVRLQDATNFLQDFLGKQNHFANQVQLVAPVYDPQTNKAPVHWEVTLGPTVLVQVIGAKLSRRKLHSLVPIYEENGFDQDLVEEGQRNLVSYYQGKGYDDVKVTPQTRREASQISLVYAVDLGDRRRVTSVRISGNRHFSQVELAGQLTVQKAEFFSHGKSNNDLLSSSVKNLKAYYQNAGYADADVESHVAEHGRNVEVTFRIREGELTRVDALNVIGNKTQPLEKLAPAGLNLKPGEPYSQARLTKDRSQIIAHYLDLGYPNATLLWSVNPVPAEPHRVVVTYDIDEGPQVHISDVAFVGNTKTKLAVLERNTLVKAGKPLSEAQVLASESTLYNLGIFDSASVDPRTPITDQTSEEMLVRVHEAKRNSLTYGFGLLYTPVAGSLSSGIVALPGLPTLGIPSSFKIIEKTVFSPLGSVELSRLNMFGRAETASVSTFLSVLDQRGSFSYADPQFRGLRWSSLLSATAERSAQNPLFTARLGTASFQMEKILNTAKTKRLQLSYRFQRTTLSDLLIQNFIPPEDENVRSSMLAASFINDTRDKPLDAHRGVFETVDFGVSPRFMGSTDNFERFYGQAAIYRQIRPWVVWANSVRLGLVDSFAGSHVPISEKFFSGGADSLRGFPLNGAGPQILATLCTAANNPGTCTFKITAPEGGRELFIVNSEGRFPIPITFPSPIDKNLGAVIFYDGGNVYNTIGFRGFISNYSNTVGIGLRYQTPIGPVRIDVGHNLNPVPGLKSTNLFVTLGQSF
jgi:outer membrane protein assembly factor BamA